MKWDTFKKSRAKKLTFEIYRIKAYLSNYEQLKFAKWKHSYLLSK